jgi:hypothetical protein
MLKESVISGAETIVDRLDDYEEKMTTKNPIK